MKRALDYNIKRLESLVALAKAASSAALSNPSIVSVANAAAAPAADQGAALTLPGTLLYVQTFRRWFEMIPDSGATVDGVTVLTAGGGTRRWVWVEEMTDSFWWSQTSWTIDPINGNDEAAGSVAAPIKNIAELCRRFRDSNLTGSYVVTFLSAPNASDRVDFVRVGLNSATMTVHGGRTISRSSTLTAGTANQNSAANTRASAVDSSIANWTADLNRMMVDTAVGAMGWIYANNGANTARIGDTKDLATGLTHTAIASTNAYSVETPWGLKIGNLEFFIMADAATFANPIAFDNFDMQVPTGFSNMSMHLRGRADNFISFTNCRFLNTVVFITGGSGAQFINCFFNLDLPVVLGGGLPAVLLGGVCLQASVATVQCPMILDLDLYISGGLELPALGINGTEFGVSAAIMARVGIFDAAANGLTIVDGAQVDLTTSAFGSGALLWGAQNAGRGLNTVGTTVRWHQTATLPVLTGTGGDFLLGGATAGRNWNEAGGVYGASVATTWANLNGAAGRNLCDVATQSCITNPP